jgi:hypothetical protein
MGVTLGAIVLTCFLTSCAANVDSSIASMSRTTGKLSVQEVKIAFARNGYALYQLKVNRSTDAAFLTGHTEKYILTIEVVLRKPSFERYWNEYAGFAYGNYPITHVANVIIDCQRHVPGRINTNARRLQAFPTKVLVAIHQLRTLSETS